ncbi:hypothetical protein K438DRAFT_1854096 [Mycena galopus ATCC 62051]|nr:hypothetical protein K438DRAFT_1854096 [Mycena galopus ATCC 62051]
MFLSLLYGWYVVSCTPSSGARSTNVSLPLDLPLLRVFPPVLAHDDTQVLRARIYGHRGTVADDTRQLRHSILPHSLLHLSPLPTLGRTTRSPSQPRYQADYDNCARYHDCEHKRHTERIDDSSHRHDAFASYCDLETRCSYRVAWHSCRHCTDSGVPLDANGDDTNARSYHDDPNTHDHDRSSSVDATEIRNSSNVDDAATDDHGVPRSCESGNRPDPGTRTSNARARIGYGVYLRWSTPFDATDRTRTSALLFDVGDGAAGCSSDNYVDPPHFHHYHHRYHYHYKTVSSRSSSAASVVSRRTPHG